jgi:hypothetical protein
MTLLGAAAGRLVSRAPAEPGRYGVREIPGGERLELLGILTRQDGAWLLSRSLVIRAGASLEVRKATLRLRSEPNRFVGLEARGGNLEITDSTVTSWAPGAGRPDDRAGDGRAWVLARDGAVLRVLRSHMEQLGYARAERYGVAWRTGTTSGTIHRSTFAGNWYGVYLQGTRNLQVEDSVFRHNARHGLVLAAGCASATVRGNQSYANAGHGMVVSQGSTTSASPPTRSTTTSGRASTSTAPCASASPATSSTATTSASTSTAAPARWSPTPTASPPTASTACGSPAAPPRSPRPGT